LCTTTKAREAEYLVGQLDCTLKIIMESRLSLKYHSDVDDCTTSEISSTSNTNAVSGDSTVEVIVYNTVRTWENGKFDNMTDKIKLYNFQWVMQNTRGSNTAHSHTSHMLPVPYLKNPTHV
jgi:hypothetical protein